MTKAYCNLTNSNSNRFSVNNLTEDTSQNMITPNRRTEIIGEFRLEYEKEFELIEQISLVFCDILYSEEDNFTVTS